MSATGDPKRLPSPDRTTTVDTHGNHVALDFAQLEQAHGFLAQSRVDGTVIARDPSQTARREVVMGGADGRSRPEGGVVPLRRLMASGRTIGCASPSEVGSVDDLSQ